MAVWSELLPNAPNRNEGTVGDFHGTIVYTSNDQNVGIENLKHQRMPIYPSIQFKAQSHCPDLKQDPILQSLLNTAFKLFENQARPLVDAITSTFSLVQENLPGLTTAVEALLPTDHHNFSELAPSLKAIAWHPHRQMLAVAHKDRSVYIYDYDDDKREWDAYVISHSFMVGVTSMEWKNRSAGILAVGCRNGVCVWHLSGQNTAHLETSNLEKCIMHCITNGNPRANFNKLAYMQFLRTSGFRHISSIAWDPTLGSETLAVASAVSSTVMMYDLLTLEETPLQRRGKGNLLMRWSPDGEWLYVAASGGVARLWKTSDWTSTHINNPAGLYVRTACWSPDSKSLYYSMNKRDVVYILYNGDIGANASKDASQWNIQALSTHKSEIKALNGDSEWVGGPIKEITIDPNYGYRLAVTFEDCPLVALYETKRVTSALLLSKERLIIPIGYIRGMHVTPSSMTPLQNSRRALHICFSPIFKTGALLATAWDNDEICFTTHIGHGQ